MSQETLKSEPRELNFYGEGKAHDIKRGFAITSIRKPRADYEFEVGERILANCMDDNEKVPVIVISNNEKKLNEHSIPVLALDGFFSAKQAAKDMRRFPGYDKTKTTTRMMAITFVKEETFNALTIEQQKKLLSFPIDESIKDRDFRHIFFPTMCNHLAYLGGTLSDWADFLYVANSLINTEEYDSLKSFEVDGIQYSRILNDNQEMFYKLTLDPLTSPFLQRFVLAFT